jgi:hypothetical protein
MSFGSLNTQPPSRALCSCRVRVTHRDDVKRPTDTRGTASRALVLFYSNRTKPRLLLSSPAPPSNAV